MKNTSTYKFYQLAAILAIVFASISCSDSFFQEPAGEMITPDQHYKSLTDVQTSAEGAIIPLQVMLPNLVMLDGLRSDMMDVTANADAYLQAINNQSFTVDNPYLDPSGYYKVIINVNELLANIDKVALIDRNFDDFYLHYVKGGLIGLRGWSYLNLVRLYGKAAWITDNVTSVPENLQQNFLTKEVLIDTLINQIKPYIHDINAAIELAELHIQNYPNTKALLGELYLEKNDYANAITYLKMSCESYGNSTGMLKVDKGYTKEAWKNIFINSEYGSTENIAQIPFSSTAGQVNPLPQWMLYSDKFVVKPTQLLIDSFKTQIPQAGKVLGDIYRGIGITFDTTSTGEPYISKYSLDQGEPYSTDIIFSRAADVHLMLAEALNRSGDSETALILLNAGFAGEKAKPAPYFKWSANLGVRGRALLKARVVPDSINGEPLLDMARTEYIEDLIMDERTLELAFEGKRWFDLVRVAKRRGTPEYLANKVAAKFEAADPAKASAIRSKLLNEANWYLPLSK
ncbi:MAG: RagB/SusD family nutrient uptake outer membrane protein [Prolixibacteraceae bacterium]